MSGNCSVIVLLALLSCVSPHSHGVRPTWGAPTGHGVGGPELKHCPPPPRCSPAPRSEQTPKRSRRWGRARGPAGPSDARARCTHKACCAGRGGHPDARGAEGAGPGPGRPLGDRGTASRPLSYLRGGRGRGVCRLPAGAGAGSVAGSGSVGRRRSRRLPHLQRLLAARPASALTRARGGQASARDGAGCGAGLGGRGGAPSGASAFPRLPLPQGSWAGRPAWGWGSGPPRRPRPQAPRALGTGPARGLAARRGPTPTPDALFPVDCATCYSRRTGDPAGPVLRGDRLGDGARC